MRLPINAPKRTKTASTTKNGIPIARPPVAIPTPPIDHPAIVPMPIPAMDQENSFGLDLTKTQIATATRLNRSFMGGLPFLRRASPDGLSSSTDVQAIVQ